MRKCLIGLAVTSLLAMSIWLPLQAQDKVKLLPYKITNPSGGDVYKNEYNDGSVYADPTRWTSEEIARQTEGTFPFTFFDADTGAIDTVIFYYDVSSYTAALVGFGVAVWDSTQDVDTMTNVIVTVFMGYDDWDSWDPLNLDAAIGVDARDYADTDTFDYIYNHRQGTVVQDAPYAVYLPILDSIANSGRYGVQATGFEIDSLLPIQDIKVQFEIARHDSVSAASDSTRTYILRSACWVWNRCGE